MMTFVFKKLCQQSPNNCFTKIKNNRKIKQKPDFLSVHQMLASVIGCKNCSLFLFFFFFTYIDYIHITTGNAIEILKHVI